MFCQVDEEDPGYLRGYADRPLEISLAAAEARLLHGPAKCPLGLALQAPVKGGRGGLWSCGILLIVIGIVTGRFSFSMKPDGDQLAKAGPEHLTPAQVGQSDRCMELYVMQLVAAGSNQNPFEATACLEILWCVSARAFLSSAVIVFCRWRRRPHSGLLGVRIGEAANPGPDAASATANRRREQMTQEALQTIIQLLLSMVAVLAGDNPATKSQLAGIQNLMTNMTGGLADEVEPPARRVSFDDSVGQADNDGFQTVSRRRARKNQSPPEPDTTKGGGKTKSFAAVVGAGLSSGKGKGKGVPQPPKQQGKAAKAPPGAPARPQLRDRDWNGAIFSYDKAASQLNSLNGSMLVHVRDAEQADALMMMLTGAGAKCSARLVGVDPDGTLKLPIAGESKDGKDVRIHHFACVDFLTPGTLLPTLKHAPTAAKAVPPGEATTTLRIVFGKLFLEEADWTRASSAPRLPFSAGCGARSRPSCTAPSRMLGALLRRPVWEPQPWWA